MNPMLHIRKVVFGVTQDEMAEIASVSQGTVCKWEKGELEPNRATQQQIRDEARRRGIKWKDSLFFEKSTA